LKKDVDGQGRQARAIVVSLGVDRKDRLLRPETVLAGLPRLVRIADETRWRGQAATATALVIAAFWASSWALGQDVEPIRTAASFAAVAIPTFLVVSLASARRVRESLRFTSAPPRSSVHETHANSRERRLKLAGVILTGIVLLLIFDRFTGGGGVMAGLLAGLLGPLGIADWREARLWDLAERERDARLYVLIRPDALTPKLGAADVYETQRPRPGDRRRLEPSPFDLGI
jgi:hypothetical protein